MCMLSHLILLFFKEVRMSRKALRCVGNGGSSWVVDGAGRQKKVRSTNAVGEVFWFIHI